MLSRFGDMEILREQKCVLSVPVLSSGKGDSLCSSHSAAGGQEMLEMKNPFLLSDISFVSSVAHFWDAREVPQALSHPAHVRAGH